MDLQAQQLQMLFQMTDSMFPSGAFVHSEGLETYVQQGVVTNAEQLGDLLRSRLLEGSAKLDMVALHTANEIYHSHDESGLYELDERLSAMKTVREVREASERVGRQMLRTVLAFHQDSFLSDYQIAIRDGDMRGHQAIVFGLFSASAKIEKRAAIIAYGYSIVSGQVSAAIKLMRLGQSQAQALIYASQEYIAEAAEIALSLKIEEMQAFTPALDIRAMQHEYLFRRLFNS